MITNEITLALIDEALKTFPLGPGEGRPNGVQKWPGTTFPMRYDAAQHKHKLGNKSVEKITVFRPDKGMMPYLLFWIEDAPLTTRSLPPSKMRKPRARL